MRRILTSFAAAAALLGVAACDGYITPNHPEATYLVSGTVSDPEGNPIPNLRVSGFFTEDVNLSIVDTDKDGIFRDSVVTWPGYLWYVIDDVDGAANGGRFQSDTIHFEEMNFVKIRKGLKLDNKGTFEAELTRTLQYR